MGVGWCSQHAAAEHALEAARDKKEGAVILEQAALERLSSAKALEATLQEQAARAVAAQQAAAEESAAAQKVRMPPIRPLVHFFVAAKAR